MQKNYLKKGMSVALAACVMASTLPIVSIAPMTAQAATYIYENQENYASVKYPCKGYESATVKSGGCGMMSTLNIINNMAGKKIYTVKECANIAIKSGARANGGTDVKKLVSAINKDSKFSKDYTISVKVTENTDELVNHLKTKQMAVMHQGGDSKYKIFATYGHYVSAVDIDDKKQIRVLDPKVWKGKYSEKSRVSRIVKGYNDGCLVTSAAVKKCTTAPSYYLITMKVKNPATPSKPTLSATDNSIIVKWPTASGATSYKVQISDKSDFSSSNTYTTTACTKTITSYAGKTLAANKTYYVRVLSLRNNGRLSSNSVYGASNSTTMPVLKETYPSFVDGVWVTGVGELDGIHKDGYDNLSHYVTDDDYSELYYAINHEFEHYRDVSNIPIRAVMTQVYSNGYSKDIDCIIEFPETLRGKNDDPTTKRTIISPFKAINVEKDSNDEVIYKGFLEYTVLPEIKSVKIDTPSVTITQGDYTKKNITYTKTYCSPAGTPAITRKVTTNVGLNADRVGQQSALVFSTNKTALPGNATAAPDLKINYTYYVRCKAPSLKATAKTKAATLTWNKVSGASSYKIYRATSKTGTYTCVKTAANTTTSWTNSSLGSKKTYYYKIVAVNNNSKCNSAYSSIVTVKTK